MSWSYSTGLTLADRGLQYGDGLFETLLLVNPTSAGGSPYLWLLDRHLARLQAGCDLLGIRHPRAQLREGLDQALLQATDAFAVLKIMVTASSPGRGYGRSKPAPANVHMSLHPAINTPSSLQTQVRVRVADTHLASQPKLAGLKHLNRLEQVLARLEMQPEDFELLLLNSDQGVVEATSSNLFAVIDGRLCTPALTHCGVDGVLRQWLLSQLGERLEVCELSLDSLRQATELLLGNSVMGIRAVGELIGPGWSHAFEPGPRYGQLNAMILASVAAGSG